ncbi:nucleoid-associated protein [Paenibacillus sp. FA6]|uniref:nucleoid-associated protein n=1 Tax=Paenibacillus sp. FA6 TaxID=3413029 RepID=UPI003F656A82
MALDFTGATIDKLIVHRVGNKMKGDEMVLSQRCADIRGDSLPTLLGKFFFQRIKENEAYNFYHINDIGFNEIYQYVKSIFCGLVSFEINSQNIAKQLYEVSTHPNIRTGELCIAFIKGVTLNGVVYDSVGIFKTESKESFLRISGDENKFTVEWEQGIDTNKLDKGCIVFNTQMENGYNIALIDSGSSIDTKYWTEDFLGIQKSNNDFNKTKTLVDACKEFTKKDYIGEKADKVAMLNSVVEYIKTNPIIDLGDFTDHVAKQANRSEELKFFINDYAEKKECKNIDNFFVNPSALKNIKRSIKNFIRLDTDIEIKINSSSEDNIKYLEKGYDENRQMHFYKIYFNEEE